MEGDGAVEIACAGSPEIPLDTLKNLTVQMLSAAVWAVGQAVRDPPGGNIELLLVPLLRLFYNLLVMGVIGDDDLEKVLRLMEPAMFLINAKTPKEEEEEDNGNVEEWLENRKKDDAIKQGLLQMNLPEAVKLEVHKLAHIVGINSDGVQNFIMI